LIVQRPAFEDVSDNRLLAPKDPLGEQRGKLRVAEDTTTGFDESGVAVWRWSCSSHV
jgi:hypothetical protein